MSDLQELRQLAEAATPGMWEATNEQDNRIGRHGDPDGVAVVAWILGARVVTPSDAGGPEWRPSSYPVQVQADAQFIAACSPDAVLGLIARAEKAERERDEWRDLCTWGQPPMTTVTEDGTVCRVERCQLKYDRQDPRHNSNEWLYRLATTEADR